MSTSTSTRYSVVQRQIVEVLGTYAFGISMYRLAWLERSYQERFKRSLNYKSLGVKNIEELLKKLGDKKKVLFFKPPEMEEEFVISSRNIEIKRGFLKLRAQELLDENSGEIAFTSFEDLYMDRFKLKLKYHRYGLTNLDHLCEVLKDVVVVGANSSGEKVIKAAEKIYNLRKRKRTE